jgi:small subunit ribosomal protein S1
MSEELLNAPEQTQEIEQNVENVAPVVEETAPAAEEAMPAVEEKAPKAPRKMREFENPYADAMANFDWDKVSDQNDRYSKEEQTRLEDLYTKSFKSIDQDDVITGKVVSINDREVVINIGFKSDGVINASELRYNHDLKIGDEIEVYVESQEDANGQMQLSHKRALILKSWQRVN